MGRAWRSRPRRYLDGQRAQIEVGGGFATGSALGSGTVGIDREARHDSSARKLILRGGASVEEDLPESLYESAVTHFLENPTSYPLISSTTRVQQAQAAEHHETDIEMAGDIAEAIISEQPQRVTFRVATTASQGSSDGQPSNESHVSEHGSVVSLLSSRTTIDIDPIDPYRDEAVDSESDMDIPPDVSLLGAMRDVICEMWMDLQLNCGGCTRARRDNFA